MFSKAKQMLSDNGAVSPVIGVILMVAVTVVLGAVIAGFVFGIGDSLGEPAPNAQIGFDYDADEGFDTTGDGSDDTFGLLEVYHDGGDAITGENTGALSVNTEGDVMTWYEADGTDSGESENRYVIDDGESYSAGDDIVDLQEVESGDETTLYWEGSDGDQSSALGTHEAP